MSQVGIVRDNAILPFKAATDLTGKEGQPVIINAQGEAEISQIAASTPPIGILLKGGQVGENVSVAIATGGFAGTVRVKLGEPVTETGALLELLETPEGCKFMPYSGAVHCYVMAQALETGLADEKIEAVLFRPRIM